MTRKRSLTSELYRAARRSNDLRAMGRGPVAYSARLARKRVYSRSMGATGRLLRSFGLR